MHKHLWRRLCIRTDGIHDAFIAPSLACDKGIVLAAASTMQLARRAMPKWQRLACKRVRSTQQRQHALRQLVGLSNHGGTGLLQDLSAREVGGFHREVGIHDAATRRRLVFYRDLQV